MSILQMSALHVENERLRARVAALETELARLYAERKAAAADRSHTWPISAMRRRRP